MYCQSSLEWDHDWKYAWAVSQALYIPEEQD